MSTSKRATDDLMSELHGLLAKEMRDKLVSGDYDARDLAVMRAFLKDNHIEVAPGSGSVLDKMGETLAALERAEQVDPAEYMN